MTETCWKCKQAPTEGQRLWPTTERNEATGKYEPRRVCSGCLARIPVGVQRPVFGHRGGARLIGTANPLAKLDERDVRKIIVAYRSGRASQKDLAKKYGVGLTTVGAIVRGKKWRHVFEGVK